MLFTDYHPGLPTAVIASAVLLVILVCVVPPIAVCIIWKKRHAGKRGGELKTGGDIYYTDVPPDV